MTLRSVYRIKYTAISLLFFSILFCSIAWVSSKGQSSPFGMDGSVEPFFDVPSAGFDPESSMFSEPGAVPMYPPKSPGNRSPFGGKSSPFSRPPFGGSRSPFGNLPSSSSPFGSPEISSPWERFNPRGPSNPFSSRPRIGISSFGPSSPKLNGGFTPPWQQGMSSRSFPVDSNLMDFDDIGPPLGRRHRKTKAQKPQLFPADRMGGGDPEDGGIEPWREEDPMGYENAFPMMELPGYEDMLMGGRRMLDGRGRTRNSGFNDDLGGGYVEDAAEPPYGDSYGNPMGGGGGGKRFGKKHNRPRNQKFPEEEAYTGSGMSYGPYGYQDPDFDESLIEEFEMVDQQADQLEEEGGGGPNDQMYAKMDENNLKQQFNQPMRNDHLSKGGDKKMKTTKKPNSADALEEEVVFGNVRRSVGETPQDVLNKITSDSAAAARNGNGNLSTNRGPSEIINGLRSPPRSKGFIRSGGGRVQNSINLFRPQGQQSNFRVGSRRPSASEEEESIIRGTLPSPGQLAPGRNLYPGLDGYGMEPQRNRDAMYPLNELNRRRRNALTENYYGDAEAYPILRPLPVPITPKYLYGDQPIYTYDLPSLVFNRMKREGGPEQFMLQPRPIGIPRQGPRRVIRRIIRRRPLLQRQRRLRQQLLPQEQLTDYEEGSYENTGEVETVTPAVPQPNANTNNTSTTEATTTTPTTSTTSPPTEATVPPQNANPKPEAPDTKPVKADHKRKRETGLYS